MNSIKTLFATCLLLAHLLGNLSIFYDLLTPLTNQISHVTNFSFSDWSILPELNFTLKFLHRIGSGLDFDGEGFFLFFQRLDVIRTKIVGNRFTALASH